MKIPAMFARSELRRALWYFRREFLAVCIFSAVYNLLLITPTIYMLQIHERIWVSKSLLTLYAMSAIVLFLFGIMAYADLSRSRVLVRAGVKFDALLSKRVFNASFDAYLAEPRTTQSTAFSDLMNIRQFLTGNGIFAFVDVPWTPIYLTLIFLLHPWLGWMCVVFALIQAFLAWLGHRTTVPQVQQASRSAGEVEAYVHSKLRNTEVIESMGMVESLRRRWAVRNGVALADADESQRVSSKVEAWSKFVRYTQATFSLAGAAILCVRGELTLGTMVAVNLLMTRALSPIDQLVGGWRGWILAKAAFLRLETLLQQYPERDENLRRVAPQGVLTLRGVVASAPGRAEPILKGIDLEAHPGTITAIVGPSGSGKSTLARAIIGIWPEVQGEVLLDGLPVASWNRLELGPYLGYLPQDTELFDGTIAENIARMVAEPDSDKVIEAARATGLHELILRMPKGYDTPIGEGGRALSGGQRQRIGLARALYGDPRLLVLDEPNANLDDIGEQALVKALQHLRTQGRTVVLVTHRPGVLGVADRLVLMKDGRITADGPRDAVLAALRGPQPPAGPAADPIPPALSPA